MLHLFLIRDTLEIQNSHHQVFQNVQHVHIPHVQGSSWTGYMHNMAWLQCAQRFHAHGHKSFQSGSRRTATCAPSARREQSGCCHRCWAAGGRPPAPGGPGGQCGGTALGREASWSGAAGLSQHMAAWLHSPNRRSAARPAACSRRRRRVAGRHRQVEGPAPGGSAGQPRMVLQALLIAPTISKQHPHTGVQRTSQLYFITRSP